MSFSYIHFILISYAYLFLYRLRCERLLRASPQSYAYELGVILWTCHLASHPLDCDKCFTISVVAPLHKVIFISYWTAEIIILFYDSALMSQCVSSLCCFTSPLRSLKSAKPVLYSASRVTVSSNRVTPHLRRWFSLLPQARTNSDL